MSDLNKENIIPPYFYFNTKYAEWFEDLNNEQAGQAIKSICSYVTLKELPKAEDPAVKIVVTAMKQDIDKSFKKYRAQCENGKKGGAPKGNKNAAKQKPAMSENCKSFRDLPFDDIGFLFTCGIDCIHHEMSQYSIDYSYLNNRQLADAAASYALGKCDCISDFYISDTITNEVYKNIKEKG